MDVIQRYCSEHHLEERPKKKPKPDAAIDDTPRKKRHVVIGESYNSGLSVPEIMAEFNIKQTTVLDHLFSYLKEGHALRSDGLLTLSSIPDDQRTPVLEAFENLGAEFLRPAYEALGRKISYDELKIFRLYHLSRNNVTVGPEFGQSTQTYLSKRIVCLANSRKYSGRCIAGKEINGEEIGKWIRPVSRQETGELSLKEMKFGDGSIPKVLDVLSVRLTRPCPHAYQSENYLIDDRQWVKHGALSISALSGMVDDVPQLWINGHHSQHGLNDRIPLEMAEEDISSSLLLVRPETLVITVDAGPDSLKKIRSKFTFNGVQYGLTVTDPEIETTYFNKDFGEYPVSEENVYICVSIGEPFEGYCYKLVAGIIR